MPVEVAPAHIAQVMVAMAALVVAEVAEQTLVQQQVPAELMVEITEVNLIMAQEPAPVAPVE
jgi:hypothetical protein